MSRFACVIAVAAVLIIGSAAEGKSIIGVGAQTCGTWTQSRHSPMDAAVVQWVLGYISSANMYEPNTPDFIQGTDYNAIIAWMDNYCRVHPLDRIDIAALALVGELLAKKR
jgi:hypothetical protein